VSSPPVVNASPLIYLAHADLIELLQVVEGSSVHVTRTVSEEILRRGPQDPTAQILKNTSWLSEVEPVPPSSRVLSWRLGPGETSVLSWALAHGTVAIVDDLAARRCAEVLGLDFIGTLGLVLRAKRKGLLPAARPAVDKLLAAGMYLSEKVLNRALALVGE
jgi:predicted nucleic acid-binding protein